MKTIKELLSSAERWIRQEYGIELEWGEKAILQEYVIALKKFYDEGYLRESTHGAAAHLFMLDFFCIDSVTVTSFNRSNYDPYNPLELTLWLEDLESKQEKFKQYCRNHVQEWRDKRDLI